VSAILRVRIVARTGEGDGMTKRAFAGAFSLCLLEPDTACSEPAEIGAGPCVVAEAGDAAEAITRDRGMG
jgi:hypothetical protein